jgi:hypothetical protein
LYILERLALAERAQAVFVRAHVSADLARIGPRILPQRPADGFLQEKFFRSERRLNRGVQQIQVGLILERKLA